MLFIELPEPFLSMAQREDLAFLAASQEAWSWVDPATGQVAAIFGAVQAHDGVLHIWAYPSPRALPHMLAIARWLKRWLVALEAVRIETTVLKQWRCGHRFARLLGFRRETSRPMKLWDGFNDFHLYARVTR